MRQRLTVRLAGVTLGSSTEKRTRCKLQIRAVSKLEREARVSLANQISEHVVSGAGCSQYASCVRGRDERNQGRASRLTATGNSTRLAECLDGLTRQATIAPGRLSPWEGCRENRNALQNTIQVMLVAVLRGIRIV